MKQILKLNLVSVIALIVGFVSLPAQASIYVEPYVAVVQGRSTQDSTLSTPGGTPATTTLSSHTPASGTAFGGKLGVSVGPLAVGADYMASHYGLFSSTPDNIANYGAFASVNLLVLKVSATYFFLSKANGDQADASGKGFKVGVGFTMIPFISINLDYLVLNYDSAKSSKANSTFTSFDMKTNALMLGASIPLNLL